MLLLLLLTEPPLAYATPPAAYTEPPAPYTAPAPRDYSACLAAVKAGRSVSLTVGTTDQADYATPSLPGLTAGVYDCWRDADGTPKMRRREATQPILPRLFSPPLIPVMGGS